MFEWLGVLDFLNSREKAILLWTIALLGLAGIKSDGLGRALRGVLRTLASPKLLLLFGSAAVYCLALLFLASAMDLWHVSATKATVYWFLGTAVVLVGSATQVAPAAPITLRSLLRGALKLTILVEFLVNLYVFPFGVELALVPVIFLLVMLQVVDQYRPTVPRVTQIVKGVLVAVGFGLMTYVAASAIGDLDGFLTRKNAEDFLVAPALTVALVPFLFGVAWVHDASKRTSASAFAPPRPRNHVTPAATPRTRFAFWRNCEVRSRSAARIG